MYLCPSKISKGLYVLVMDKFDRWISYERIDIGHLGLFGINVELWPFYTIFKVGRLGGGFMRARFLIRHCDLLCRAYDKGGDENEK